MFRENGSNIIYTIRTGQFEKGSKEQQAAFIELFGKEDVQYKFDFYFHWYNIVHEYGHCLCNYYDTNIVGLMQELLVNRFAVGFWEYAGYHEELYTLEKMLREILHKMKCPVPDDLSFIAYYEQIWDTSQIMEVLIYGYFQFKSVLMALENREELAEVFKEIGIDRILDYKMHPYKKYTISIETAQTVIDDLQQFLDDLGLDHPKVNLELVDDPSIHCMTISY